MSDGMAEGGPRSEGSAGEAARAIVRGVLKGAMATLDRETGYPHASLVTLATDFVGRPIVLVSRLAVHTQNLLKDPRASILADATAPDGDPLAGGRVTLAGTMRPSDDPAVRRRFLARQPAAAGYADFVDFGFWVLDVERAHYVGGFGRIVPMSASQVLLDASKAAALAAAEAEIVDHMNSDHGAAVELYARELLGAPSGPWQLTGVDPEGCDIVCPGSALRLPFAAPVMTPAEVRQEFVRLADAARAKASASLDHR